MKHVRFRAASAFALALLAGSCAAPPPAASPTAPPPPPPAAPAPIPLSGDWQRWPIAPGTWRHNVQNGESRAEYGPFGAPLARISCEGAKREVSLAVRAAGGGTSGEMIVRTSFGMVRWPARPMGEWVVATRSAGDAALDQIAFSRGRIAVEAPGATPLALPVWAEIVRVVEDCRG